LLLTKQGPTSASKGIKTQEGERMGEGQVVRFGLGSSQEAEL